MSLLKTIYGSALALALIASAAAPLQAQTAAPKPPAAAQPAPAPAAPAQAQPAAPNGPQRVELAPSQPEWTKVCGKIPDTGKEVCYTTRDFGQGGADNAPVLALAIYDVKGDDKRQVRVLLPLGLVLKGGFRIAVDQGAWVNGAYSICLPNGCFAEAEVLGTFVASMKKGTTLNIQVRNQGNFEVVFAVPLKDFAKGFDGAPIDPKVLEDQQKALQEAVQKQAEEERKKLQPPGAPAVPGAPVAPKL